MPEGHTIHRLARLHTEWFAGAPVRVSSPQGRFADAELVDGRELEGASAVGKHLFHHYAGGLTVHVHLGLYGAFSDYPADEEIPEVVGQVRMRMLGRGRSGIGRCSDLRGPTRCEVLDSLGLAEIEDRLGPDPIDPEATPDRVIERVGRSSRPIGALLMDQKVLAGVGNVYRAEVLFRQRVDPATPGRSTDPETIRRLWDDLTELMPLGVETGAIHTIRPPHDHGDLPRRGADRPRNYVYQRDGLACRVCGTEVRVAPMEGRSLYWCPTCQVE